MPSQTRFRPQVQIKMTGDLTITQSGSDGGLKTPEIMSEIQARVKVPRAIFVHSVMIKNQQFHRRTQNEQN